MAKARQRLAAQTTQTLPESVKPQADSHAEEKAQSPGESPKVGGEAAGGSKGPIGVMGVEEVKTGREMQQMHWSTSTAVSDEEVRAISTHTGREERKEAWAHLCLDVA